MKKYTQLTYEQRYSIHLLNKDTVKLLLPNQWAASVFRALSRNTGDGEGLLPCVAVCLV
jgi:hypothetical protein